MACVSQSLNVSAIPKILKDMFQNASTTIDEDTGRQTSSCLTSMLNSILTKRGDVDHTSVQGSIGVTTVTRAARDRNVRAKAREIADNSNNNLLYDSKQNREKRRQAGGWGPFLFLVRFLAICLFRNIGSMLISWLVCHSHCYPRGRGLTSRDWSRSRASGIHKQDVKEGSKAVFFLF